MHCPSLLAVALTLPSVFLRKKSRHLSGKNECLDVFKTSSLCSSNKQMIVIGFSLPFLVNQSIMNFTFKS